MTTMTLGRKTAQISSASYPAAAPLLGLDDLSFLTCIERTELGETWKVRTPAGQVQLCQFLPPADPGTSAALLGWLNTFRHRGLVPWLPVHGEANRLALLSPLDGPTLWERFRELWEAKQPGVPREELLGYLRCVATTLDFLQSRHNAQHLWLHPRNVVLQRDEAKILGFGLAETWWARTQRPAGDLNLRYSAPELRRKLRGTHCDQYSLALIFAELLTGLHPWRGRGIAGTAYTPDLALLTRKDRAIIQRALSPDHRRRFDSATDLVEALEAATSIIIQPAPLRSSLFSSRPIVEQAAPDVSCSTLDQFVHNLVCMVAGKVQSPNELKVRFTLEPGRRLESRKFLGPAHRLPVFDDFCRQWHAKTMHHGDGLVILAINAAPSVWQWLRGRRLGLELRLEFLPVAWGNQKAEAAVTVKPFGCDQERARRLLMELGPKLLRGVRSFLHAQPEQRRRERQAIRQRLRVCPVVNGAAADAIECVSKDISPGGIGFLLPAELPASQVYVNFPEMEKLASHGALAQVVRKQPAGDGWLEVGAAFPIAGW